MNMSTDHLPAEESPPMHQPDQVDIRGVVRIGIGLAAIVLVAMIGMVVYFRVSQVTQQSELPAYATSSRDLEPPAPQLDPLQSQHLKELRQRHEELLTSYEWIDKERGIARIPITRAMELLDGQLPVRDQE